MAAELEITIMDGTDPRGDLKNRLRVFEERHNVSVHITILAWEAAWADIVKYGMYAHGPDISEIGSTWLSSLVDMNALRPLSKDDIELLGGADAFLPQMWQEGMAQGQSFAVPWFGDVRLLYYRRDILHRYGIDPAQAFQTAQSLETCLQQLKEAGADTPWLVPTDRTLNTLHIASSWVWGAGGDFISPDGREILFARPESLKGFIDYFSLGRFISPRLLGLGDARTNSRFRNGKAVTVVSGPWVGLGGFNQAISAHTASPDVIQHCGATRLPGVPFVGSSSLVIWKHSRKSQLALKLVEFLSSAEFQRSFYPYRRMYPTRLDVLNNNPSTELKEVWTAGVDSLRQGRTFPVVPRWGLLEDRLTQEFGRVWSALSLNPGLDLEKMLTTVLENLAERLQPNLDQ